MNPLRFLPLLVVLAPLAAHAEGGIPCGPATLEPPPGSNVPANLPGFAYNMSPGPPGNIADAKLQLTDGAGASIPFTVEGTGPRYVLRLAAPLKVGVVRLAHDEVCGSTRLHAEVSWAVAAEVPFPAELGDINLLQSSFRPSPTAVIRVTLSPRPAVLPFLGATRFTLTARRAGVVVARLTDRPLYAGNDLGQVNVPCDSASDSGPVEIEARAIVAGTTEAATAGLVARATTTLTCPASSPPDGGAADDGGVPPVTADASPDTAPGSSSGCSVSRTGQASPWLVLLALAAVLRSRRWIRR
jgi:hypothetical protein